MAKSFRSVNSPLAFITFVLLGALLLTAKPSDSLALSPPDAALTIVVRDGQSLRDIAQEYFNDPNLWEEILRVNGLDSPDGVRPGMKLKIPRNAITVANAALVHSLDAIQKATETGARVFAAEPLEMAVKNRQQALTMRQNSDWVQCRDLANEAKKDADRALELTRAQRNAAAQAVLRGASGTVQSRSASALVWNRIRKGATLSEKEKVRTMSDSAAEILFVDESRIRLVANSQAVIQRMRVDRLNDKQEASVSLEEGDVFALLSSAGGGKGVNVKVSGVTTDTDSTDYWISRKGKQAKFANYDDVDMKITSDGQTVTLGRNQGTIVEDGRKPAIVRDLLPAPELVEPADDFVQLGETTPKLTWSSITGAVHYKLEAATDPSFSDIVYRRSRARDTEHQPSKLEDGVYYWRVSAVDDLGFPGAKSSVRRFQVMQQVALPFLALRAPDEMITRSPSVVVSGEADTRGALTLNGAPIEISEDGTFSLDHALEEGENTMLLELRGESGKTARLERHVVFMPDRPASIEYDQAMVRTGDKRFATRGRSFVLAGTTMADARIDVLPTTSGTYTDATGRFELHLPISGNEQELLVRLTSPSGHITEQNIIVERDTQPPALRVQSPPPLVTAEESVQIQGSAASASMLRLNGETVHLNGDSFEARHELIPGPNQIELVASDEVGNESRWSRRVFRDSSPPALRSTAASSRKVKGGDVIELEVAATDDTEMKRFASALVQVGNWKETADLSLDIEKGIYRGSVRIPRSVAGTLNFKHVILEDYLGNKKAYALR